MKECPICNEHFKPINSDTEEWEQNCSCPIWLWEQCEGKNEFIQDLTVCVELRDIMLVEKGERIKELEGYIKHRIGNPYLNHYNETKDLEYAKRILKRANK